MVSAKGASSTTGPHAPATSRKSAVRTTASTSSLSAKKIARREHILSVAKEMFMENGYELVNLNQVAFEADVAKGTIYLYFNDKSALFEGVIDNWIAEHTVRRRHRLPAVPMTQDAFAQSVVHWLRERDPQEFIQLLRLTLSRSFESPHLLAKVFKSSVMPLAVRVPVPHCGCQGDLPSSETCSLGTTAVQMQLLSLLLLHATSVSAAPGLPVMMSLTEAMTDLIWRGSACTRCRKQSELSTNTCNLTSGC